MQVLRKSSEKVACRGAAVHALKPVPQDIRRYFQVVKRVTGVRAGKHVTGVRCARFNQVRRAACLAGVRGARGVIKCERLVQTRIDRFFERTRMFFMEWYVHQVRLANEDSDDSKDTTRMEALLFSGACEPKGDDTPAGGQHPASNAIPEYDRSWHRFPDSDVRVRIGSDKKLDAGIYQQVSAMGSFIYVLLEELPGSAREVREAVQRWTAAGKDVIVSHGTCELYENEVAIYTGESTGPIYDCPTGFLIVGSRGHCGWRGSQGRRRRGPRAGSQGS